MGQGMEPCLQASTLESAAQVPMAAPRNKVEVDCSTQLGHVIAGMAGLFRDRLLCDVTVIVGATEFKAHACVLAAVSGYFRGLLVGVSPIKKAATKIPLTFEHVTAAAFAAVLDCIYTGKMVVEEESIVAVVHISNKLELLAVRSACIGHLVSRVQDSNMEQMLALGQELACTELVDAAKAAIRKRSAYGSPNGDDEEEEELACTEVVDAATAAIRKRSGYGSPNGDDKEEEELACTEVVDAATAAIRKRSGYGSPNGDDKEEDDQVAQLVVRFSLFFCLSLFKFVQFLSKCNASLFHADLVAIYKAQGHT